MAAVDDPKPKYLLRVTAGPSYDPATHVEVPVNAPRLSSAASSSSSSSSSCLPTSSSPSSSSSPSRSSSRNSNREETAAGERNDAPDESGRRGSDNGTGTVRIVSEHCEAHVAVRVHNFRGFPRDAPSTSPYFRCEPHCSRGDQYSIAVRFRLLGPGGSGAAEDGGERGSGSGSGSGSRGGSRSDLGEGVGAGRRDGDGGIRGSRSGGGGEDPQAEPDETRLPTNEDDDGKNDTSSDSACSSSSGSSTFSSSSPSPGGSRSPRLSTPVPGVPATDLQFGNDFDRPIRDRLPPGFNTAMSIVKWWIDPGLEGDAYADKPYLYGPALSSFNAVHVGRGEHDPRRGGLWVEEGGDEEGRAWRASVGAPEDAKQRMRWALVRENKEKWVWEFGRWYAVDFFNPYLDFKEFALRLPGFNLPIMRYWDGQGLRYHVRRSHQLRYVLRNRVTGQVYLVVLFTLHLAEDVES